MTAGDELVMSDLAMLGDEMFDDAELDRHASRFQKALRRLRDDPAEAVRIDALVMDAERGRANPDRMDALGQTIYVNGRDIHIHVGNQRPEPADNRVGGVPAAEESAKADPAVPTSEIKWLHDLLTGRVQEQPRPRRPWEGLLRPVFGGGILVAVLVAGTAVLALHASAAAVSIMGIILATAASVTALLSVLVPWTSVRALNRRGDSAAALDLMLCGGFLRASTSRTSNLSYQMLADALAEAAKQAHSTDSAGSRRTGPDLAHIRGCKGCASC
jgi:hypothetical protein